MSAVPFLLAAAIASRLLPHNAKIIEIQTIPESAHKNRAMVLWMQVSSRDCPPYWQELWTPICPGSTRGCSYSGPTRVSLIDTGVNTIIYTLEIRGSEDAMTTLIGRQPRPAKDSVDIPIRLGRGGPYSVAKRFGKPKIMSLKDYNGDGEALEFALFDALSCSDLLTTLIGYSRRNDRVIQYPVHLRVFDDGERDPHLVNSYWVEHLLTSRPLRAGFWKYRSVYPGAVEEYEIRYVPEEEAFEGTCRVHGKE